MYWFHTASCARHLDTLSPGSARHRAASADVVLDYRLWRRSDRDAYKRLVEAHGGRWRLLYFKVDREVLARRLAERNRRDDANALAVTPSALEDFIARFDEPVDEGEELVDSGGAATRPGRPEVTPVPR